MATLTDNFNYLQPTSFKVTIDRRNYPNLEFFCQTVTHPGMLITAPEVPFRRIQGIPFPGESITFNELSLTIILDENLESYNEMYLWLRRLLETDMNDTNPLDASITNPSPYADMTLSILSSHNNQTKQVRYLDCVPTALGDIQFESTATGTEFITYVASFRFSYFELV